MNILGIDPGTDTSGVVLFDSQAFCVRAATDMENRSLLRMLRDSAILFYGTRIKGGVDWGGTPDVVAIEDIVYMSQNAGREVFETCKWIGRFREAWEFPRHEANPERSVSLIKRTDEKTMLCGGQTYPDSETGCRRGYDDSHIRRALLEKFPRTGGGKVPQVGIKSKPGPLYGFHSHLWSALAVAMTHHLIAIDDNGRKNLRG